MLADSLNSAQPTGVIASITFFRLPVFFRLALCTTLPWPSSQRDHQQLDPWVTQAQRDAEPTPRWRSTGT
jgi:hypothetical protein